MQLFLRTLTGLLCELTVNTPAMIDALHHAIVEAMTPHIPKIAEERYRVSLLPRAEDQGDAEDQEDQKCELSPPHPHADFSQVPLDWLQDGDVLVLFLRQRPVPRIEFVEWVRYKVDRQHLYAAISIEGCAMCYQAYYHDPDTAQDDAAEDAPKRFRFFYDPQRDVYGHESEFVLDLPAPPSNDPTPVHAQPRRMVQHLMQHMMGPVEPQVAALEANATSAPESLKAAVPLYKGSATWARFYDIVDNFVSAKPTHTLHKSLWNPCTDFPSIWYQDPHYFFGWEEDEDRPPRKNPSDYVKPMAWSLPASHPAIDVNRVRIQWIVRDVLDGYCTWHRSPHHLPEEPERVNLYSVIAQLVPPEDSYEYQYPRMEFFYNPTGNQWLMNPGELQKDLTLPQVVSRVHTPLRGYFRTVPSVTVTHYRTRLDHEEVTTTITDELAFDGLWGLIRQWIQDHNDLLRWCTAADAEVLRDRVWGVVRECMEGVRATENNPNLQVQDTTTSEAAEAYRRRVERYVQGAAESLNAFFEPNTMP